MDQVGYSIERYENANQSPAWPLVPHFVLELQQKDYNYTHALLPHGNDAAMVAMHLELNIALGFTMYRWDSERNSWWITASYVAPDYRKQGIHSALFNALVQRARQRGILTIESGTHPNNVAAQQAFFKQGRTLTSLGYSYPVFEYEQSKSVLDVTEDDDKKNDRK